MEKTKSPALLLPQGNTPMSDDKKTYKKCPSCNTEWTRLEESGFCPDCHNKAELERTKKARQKMFIEACLGSLGYKQFTLGNYQQTFDNAEAYKACVNFDPAKDNLYLYGSCGSGKTHLAGATWRIRVNDGLPCEFIKHPELSRLFRKIEVAEEKCLLKKFAEFDVLVIDDIGVGRSTEFSNQILYEILDNRINNLKNGLILTSNLSLDDFARKVGDDRLPSRIAGMCKVIKIAGEDHRLI